MEEFLDACTELFGFVLGCAIFGLVAYILPYILPYIIIGMLIIGCVVFIISIIVCLFNIKSIFNTKIAKI